MFRSIVATAAIMVAATPVLAEPPARCASRDRLLEQLDRGYQEQRIAVGLSNRGVVIEILASADGASWSLLVTHPGGHSCLLDAGQGWQMLPFLRGRPA
jgi:hypothetical protein